MSQAEAEVQMQGDISTMAEHEHITRLCIPRYAWPSYIHLRPCAKELVSNIRESQLFKRSEESEESEE